jgi:hypothetical protein
MEGAGLHHKEKNMPVAVDIGSQNTELILTLFIYFSCSYP